MLDRSLGKYCGASGTTLLDEAGCDSVTNDKMKSSEVTGFFPQTRSMAAPSAQMVLARVQKSRSREGVPSANRSRRATQMQLHRIAIQDASVLAQRRRAQETRDL